MSGTLELKLQDRGRLLIQQEEDKLATRVTIAIIGTMFAGASAGLAYLFDGFNMDFDRNIALSLVAISPSLTYGVNRFLRTALDESESDENSKYHSRHTELSEVIVREGFDAPTIQGLSRIEQDALRLDYALALVENDDFADATTQVAKVGKYDHMVRDASLLYKRNTFARKAVIDVIRQKVISDSDIEDLWSTYVMLRDAGVSMRKPNFRTLIRTLLSNNELDNARQALKYGGVQPLSQRQMIGYRGELADRFEDRGEYRTAEKVRALATYTLFPSLVSTRINELNP